MIIGNKGSQTMSVPIPKYLEKNSVPLKANSYYAKFKLKCDCGSTRFAVYKFVKKETKNTMDKKFSRAWNHKRITDETGKTFIAAVNLFGKITAQIPEEELEKNKPADPLTIVKCKCSKCGREHPVFDSRIHGLSGVINRSDIQAGIEGLEDFKLAAETNKLIVIVYNYSSHKDCLTAIGQQMAYEKYTMAFGHINIMAWRIVNATVVLFLRTSIIV
jgi:hypothetical protein